MKSFTFFLSVLFIVSSTIAQTGVAWQKTAGGNSTDNLSCMSLTSDSGFIVGGWSYSGLSGEKTDTSRGYADYWIIKFNKEGVIQFDKTIGGNGYDQLNTIQQTSDGGYILGGKSSSGI